MLLVEDEAVVRDAVGAALAEEGFQLREAADGAEAMRLLAQGGVDGLVTDVRPGDGPDGYAVARLARAGRPDLPVIYVTGDSAHRWMDEGVLGSVLVRKPFTARRIAAAVRQGLASPER